MNLIIHIGYAKTSTTTLQSEIFPKIPKEKFFYVGKYYKDGKQDVGFADLLPSPSKLYSSELEREHEEFEKWLKTQTKETVLISREGFMSRSGVIGRFIYENDPNVGPPETARSLKRFLKKHEHFFSRIKILITIRRQFDLIRSVNLHQRKHRRIDKMEVMDFFYSLKEPELAEYFNFLKTFKIFSTMFGSENVHLIPIEGLYEGNLRHIGEFASIINISPSDTFELFKAAPIINVSKESEEDLMKEATSISGEKEITRIYAESNRELDKLLKLELKELNYY